VAKPIFPFDVRANLWVKGVELSITRGDNPSQANEVGLAIVEYFKANFADDFKPVAVRKGKTKIRTDDAPLTDAEAAEILAKAEQPALDS